MISSYDYPCQLCTSKVTGEASGKVTSDAVESPWLSRSHACAIPSNEPSWIHMAPHFSPYSVPALTWHYALPWFGLPQFVHRLHWVSPMALLRSLLGSSTISYLMMPHLEVIRATVSAVFFIAKQCGYMMSRFMTASLCKSNSIPNCHCNPKTTYIRKSMKSQGTLLNLKEILFYLLYVLKPFLCNLQFNKLSEL